jgi:short-subunit dehydrogenase
MKKIALITGASTGIGRALRWIFAAHGYGLVLVARDRQRLDALAGELTERHAVPVRVIPKDLAQVTAAQQLYDEIVSQGMQI